MAERGGPAYGVPAHEQQQAARIPAASGIAVALVSLGVAVVVLVSAVAWAVHRTHATTARDLIPTTAPTPPVATVTPIVAGIHDGRITSTSGASMAVPSGFSAYDLTIPGIDGDQSTIRFEKKLSSTVNVFDVISFGDVTGQAAPYYKGPSTVRTTAAYTAATALNQLGKTSGKPTAITHRTLSVSGHAGHEVCFRVTPQAPYAGDTYDQYCVAVVAVDNRHAVASLVAVVSSQAVATVKAWRSEVAGIRFR